MTSATPTDTRLIGGWKYVDQSVNDPELSPGVAYIFLHPRERDGFHGEYLEWDKNLLRNPDRHGVLEQFP
jgi:hypothetical protein